MAKLTEAQKVWAKHLAKIKADFTPPGVNPIGPVEFISGNVFIRSNHIQKAGDKIGDHKHNFDHTSIVIAGSIRVEATTQDGKKIEREFYSPAHFLVKAGVKHLITALEDNCIIFCVYSHRTPQGEVTVDYNGWYEPQSLGHYS